MKSVIRIFKELSSTNSPIEKEMIIKDNLGNELFDYCIRFYLDDMVITGIARTKLNKTISKHNDKSYGEYTENLIDLLEYVKYNNTGKEEVIEYIVNSAKCHMDSEIEDLYYSLVCKDVKIGTGISTYNKANVDNPIYKHDVMSGKSWDESRGLKLIKSGNKLYFTRKVDGIRGSYNHKWGNFVSRNGKVMDGLTSIIDEVDSRFHSDLILDGEFEYDDTSNTMTSQEVRAMTVSIMNDKNITDKASHGIRFNIFDVVKEMDWNSSDEGQTYESRRNGMDMLSEMDCFKSLKYIKFIPVEFIISDEFGISQVMPLLKEFIDKGNEGLMCIASKQAYRLGKAYHMMKLKNVFSCDLKIISWNYGKEKTRLEGKFASFTVEMPYVDKNGICGKYPVTVGMGYTHQELAEINENPDQYIGQLIELLATEVSSNKSGGYSLSYARFVGFRTDKDNIDMEKHCLVEIDGEYYFKADSEIEEVEE